MSEEKHNHFNMDVICNCEACNKGREAYNKICEVYFKEPIDEDWYEKKG